VAYDEALAGRIRDLIAGEPGLSEQAMFGGLAFLIGGNMAIAASGRGGLLVHVTRRVGPARHVLRRRRFEMRGRELKGWLRVDSEQVRTKPSSRAGSSAAPRYARSLPAKGGKE
jgi:hypothetical protein